MNGTIIVIAAVLFAVLAFAFAGATNKYYRKRGVKIEQKAIAGLSLPSSWRIQPNLPVAGLGDADIYIVGPDGKSWVVEIKSYEGARKASFSFFNKDEIVRPNGKPFERNAVKQVVAVAQALEASPVIWLPKARNQRPFKTRSGVVVVQGRAAQLERAIGARTGWF